MSVHALRLTSIVTCSLSAATGEKLNINGWSSVAIARAYYMSTDKINMTKLTIYKKNEVWSSPILCPSMDGLNHLREQGADTLVDKSLEEVYSLLIIQIQPEFLLKLMIAHHTRGNNT
jgi:hypothetical protein